MEVRVQNVLQLHQRQTHDSTFYLTDVPERLHKSYVPVLPDEYHQTVPNRIHRQQYDRTLHVPDEQRESNNN